jgi:HTH-type transcriptional regulator / antitoxin HigA
MSVKVIKSQTDYEEALRTLSELMQRPYGGNSEDENTIELLLLVLKDYEQKIAESIKVDPIEAIKFRMDQMNLTQKDLIEFIGSAPRVSELLSGKRLLSLNMIRNLHAGLGIPLQSLISQNQSTEDVAVEKIDYSQFPIKELKKRGYLKQPLRDLKDYAEELIKAFCQGYDDILEQNLAFLRAPLHLRGKKTIDKHALALWQICVLKKAENQALSPYDSSLINENWLRRLIELSAHKDGPRLAKEFLEKFGIAFIIETHFPKTFLDGAAMMYKGRPIIALTLRYNRPDNFWFVLAHELAHLIKHLNTNENKVYFDDLEVHNLDEIEKEADEIANEALIPHKLWNDFKIFEITTTNQINSIAKKIHVAPNIIAGRLRHERKNFMQFSKIISPPVTF